MKSKMSQLIAFTGRTKIAALNNGAEDRPAKVPLTLRLRAFRGRVVGYIGVFAFSSSAPSRIPQL
jgi:hypothetical protein